MRNIPIVNSYTTLRSLTVVVIDLAADAEMCRSSAICGIDGTNAPRTNTLVKKDQLRAPEVDLMRLLARNKTNERHYDDDRPLLCRAESAVWIITIDIVCVIYKKGCVFRGHRRFTMG